MPHSTGIKTTRFPATHELMPHAWSTTPAQHRTTTGGCTIRSLLCLLMCIFLNQIDSPWNPRQHNDIFPFLGGQRKTRTRTYATHAHYMSLIPAYHGPPAATHRKTHARTCTQDGHTSPPVTLLHKCIMHLSNGVYNEYRYMYSKRFPLTTPHRTRCIKYTFMGLRIHNH